MVESSERRYDNNKVAYLLLCICLCVGSWYGIYGTIDNRNTDTNLASMVDGDITAHNTYVDRTTSKERGGADAPSLK